jgi:hypothetical protein
VRTCRRDRFDKIGDGGKARGRDSAASALVIERAVFKERELRAVIGEFVDLAVVKLGRPDCCCWSEKLFAACAKAGQLTVLVLVAVLLNWSMAT